MALDQQWIAKRDRYRQGVEAPGPTRGSLLSWASEQRREYRGGRLSEEQVHALMEIRGWHWGLAAWQDQYDALIEYIEREGRYPEHKSRLGRWLGNQRRRYQDGDLAADRAAKLAAIPGWKPPQSYDEMWVQGIERYVREQLAAERSAVTGKWVSDQRAYYREGTLSAERIAALEALPSWDWDWIETTWEAHFVLIKAYAAETGSAAPPRRYVVGDIALGEWVGAQRAAYQKDALAPAQVRRLESLTGWKWSVERNQAWDMRYDLLRDFIEQRGHYPLHRQRTQGTYLARWVQFNRRSHREGTLSKDRVERLEALPDWTW